MAINSRKTFVGMLINSLISLDLTRLYAFAPQLLIVLFISFFMSGS